MLTPCVEYAGAGGNERRQRARLVDAFLEDLSVRRLLVIKERVHVDRLVQLSHVRVDADLAEKGLHPERSRLVGHDRHHDLAEVGVAQQLRQQTHEHHRRRGGTPVGALGELFEELRVGRRRERRCFRIAERQRAAERLAALLQVGDFRALLVGTIVRRLAELLFGNGNTEALAHRAQLVFGELLLLMGDVLAFGRVAETVSLDGANQQDGRLPFVLDGRFVGVVDLDGIVSAQLQLLQIVV